MMMMMMMMMMMCTLAVSPRTVLVSEVTPEIDRDQLELYFENRVRSAGGPVQQVVISGTQAFVTFVDPQGRPIAKCVHLLKHICNRNNTILVCLSFVLHFCTRKKTTEVKQ